jgi:sulfur carrier protein ThiS
LTRAVPRTYGSHHIEEVAVPRVQFTRHLRIHFPDLADGVVAGGTLADVIASLDAKHPGLQGDLLDDDGSLRRHVNIFVNEEILEDRVRLSDAVGAQDRVFIMQALSGG